MICLIGAELEKIIRKRIVIAGMILVALLNVLMYQGWLGKETQRVMREDGTYAEGDEAVALDQEIAGRYEGRLTDGKVRQIVEDFALPEGFNGTDMPTGNIFRNNMYSSVSPFHDNDGNYNGVTLAEVYGEQGDNLWAAYNTSWSGGIYYLMFLFILGIAYLLIVSVTPVFSEEYGSGMDALILTTRYGKSRCAWAKVLAVFAFTLLTETVCLAVNTLFFLINYGRAGWNGSIQFNCLGIFEDVPYEINFAQAGLWAVCLWLAASLFLTGVSMLISACSRSSYAALILCVIVYTVPMFFNGRGETVNVVLSLFPIQQLELERPFAVGAVGQIPFPFVIAGLSLAVGLICSMLAKRAFARHQVRN